MPARSPWNVVAEEYRGVWPADSAGRIHKWYADRLTSLLSEVAKDVHPANYTVEHFRTAFDKLEAQLAEEREKAVVDAEVARLKAIADALEVARWSNRIKRAAKRIVNALRRFVATIKAQKW